MGIFWNGAFSLDGISHQKAISGLFKFNLRAEIEGPHMWAPLPSQPISWGNAKTLLEKLDGLEAPEKFKQESLWKIEKVGPKLLNGNKFEINIAANYERKRSQNVIGNDQTR